MRRHRIRRQQNPARLPLHPAQQSEDRHCRMRAGRFRHNKRRTSNLKMSLDEVWQQSQPIGPKRHKRIVGWRGRADQAAKVKGMFVRPEQVAQFVDRVDTVSKLRLAISHDGNKDVLTAQIEASSGDEAAFAQVFQDIFKLRASIEIVPVGSLPKDGIVIDDNRDIH